VLRASAGCHLDGAARPVPDTSHPKTLLFGNIHRFARQVPFCREEAAIIDFIDNVFIPSLGLAPLSPDADLSLEHMLASSHYTMDRKQQIRDAVEKIGGLDHALDRDPSGKFLYMGIDQHCKDESYPEFKHARAINAREDVAKAFYGRFVRLMEDLVYQHPYAIKHVPVPERADYMMNLMGEEGRFIVIDHTSLEAHVVPFWMRAVHRVFKYLCKNLPEYADLCLFLDEVLAGKNYIRNKNFSTSVWAKRMSGEMDTSLANLLLCMISLFYVLYAHCGVTDLSRIKGVGEGDDSVTLNPSSRDPTNAMFTNIGFTVKMTVETHLSRAGFCQMYFDPIERKILTDPRKALADFGYVERKYAMSRSSVHRALLRSKSLSMAYQYPACPIISRLAAYGLRVTSGLDGLVRRLLSSSSRYWRVLHPEQLDPAFCRALRENLSEPGPRTRVLCEELYGINPATQKLIEGYLDSLMEITPLRLGGLIDFPSDWVLFFDCYAVGFDRPVAYFTPRPVRCLDLSAYLHGRVRGDVDMVG